MEGRALDFIGVEGGLMSQWVRIISDGSANSPQSLTARHMCSLPWQWRNIASPSSSFLACHLKPLINNCAPLEDGCMRPLALAERADGNASHSHFRARRKHQRISDAINTLSIQAVGTSPGCCGPETWGGFLLGVHANCIFPQGLTDWESCVNASMFWVLLMWLKTRYHSSIP